MENYRRIAESYFSKKLQPDEIVHHVDGNRENNNAENLVIMKKSQHSSLHGHLGNTGRKGKRSLCNICAFVMMVEKFQELDEEIDIDTGLLLLSIMAKSDLSYKKRKLLEEKGRWRAILEQTDSDCKEWKSYTGHDCYTGMFPNILVEFPLPERLRNKRR